MPNRLFRETFAFLFGVFLLCAAVLMLQIIQTRILSVVSFYYLAFFSISMAMLGLTAGALVVYFKMGGVTAANLYSYLSRISTAFALVIASCFVLQLASPLPEVQWATLGVVWLKAIMLLAAPFIFGGIVVSLALTRSRFAVGITYGADLLGAAGGCLATLLVLDWIDAPSAMFLVATLVAIAAWCFARAPSEPIAAGSIMNWKILRRPGTVAIVLAAIGLANATVKLGLQPIAIKLGNMEQLDKFDYVKWNSFSRIAVKHPETVTPFLWGASPVWHPGRLTEQRELNIDGFAGTWMPRFSDAPGAMDYLRYDVTNLAYYARHSGKSAVIGVGSGRDVLSAHIFGFRDITGVELNPIFIDLLTDPAKLRSYAGVADLPGVRFVVDDGRSWFARTPEKFDLIEMSLVDTYAATGAGAFSLSENGLYTVEGWKHFLNALQPNGLFTVSRWLSMTAPVEIGRVVSLAVSALIELDNAKPRDHIFIAGVSNLATVIVSRQPFTTADLNALNDAADKLHFDIIAGPGRPAADPILAEILDSRDLNDLNTRVDRYFLNVSPPTDARPFFFNQLRLTNVRDMYRVFSDVWSGNSTVFGEGLVAVGNLIAVGTLLLIVLLSFIVVFFVVVLPARSTVRMVDRRLAWVGSAYFLLIGFGFMFVEIGLIQRLSVFLGHPVYALSIGLFSIILSTGIGSLLSERFKLSSLMDLIFWLGLLATYLLLLPQWMSHLTHSTLESASLPIRALVSVAVVFPAGLLMGYGFPTGLRLVSSVDPKPTPWFWGINGAAGVLASGLAVLCSIGISIDCTIRMGGICYAALLPCALLLLQMRGLTDRPADIPQERQIVPPEAALGSALINVGRKWKQSDY
jgi:hypothetical protein